MNQQLKDAYAKLNEEHPELFKGCPVELSGGYREVKNSTARKFDEGIKLDDCYLAREVRTWIVDSDENRPEFESEILRAEIQRLEEYNFENNKEGGPATTWTEYDGGIDGYGIGIGCSTLVDLRNNQDVPIDSSGFTLTKLPNGLKTQLKTFGKKIFIPVGRKGQSKKYENKEQALVNALTRAFAGRALRPSELVNNPLHLDTTGAEEDCGQAWIEGENDITKSHCCCPMFLMEYEEEQKRSVSVARRKLAEVRDYLGADKWVLLMESLQKTNAQIASEINANGGDTNTEAVKKKVQRIRKALRSLPCPF